MTPRLRNRPRAAFPSLSLLHAGAFLLLGFFRFFAFARFAFDRFAFARFALDESGPSPTGSGAATENPVARSVRNARPERGNVFFSR